MSINFKTIYTKLSSLSFNYDRAPFGSPIGWSHATLLWSPITSSVVAMFCSAVVTTCCSASASSDTTRFGKRIASSDTTTFGRRFASSDAVPVSFLISNSPLALFLNLLPLAITTLKKKPLVIIMLILRKYTISKKKEKKIHHHRGRWRHCYRHFLRSKTIKERWRTPLLYNKAIKEGGGNCCHLLLRFLSSVALQN